MPRADVAVATLVRETLVAQSVDVFPIGSRVLCFQPPDVWDRPEYLFCKSRVLSNPLERSHGWWVGTVQSVDTTGTKPWIIVVDRNGKKWDYDGDEFPVYLADATPEPIQHIFQLSDDLQSILRPRRPRASGSAPRPPRSSSRPQAPQQGPDLENEFFSRDGGDQPRRPE